LKKARIVELTGGERISTIHLAIFTQYRSVTDGRTGGIVISISCVISRLNADTRRFFFRTIDLWICRIQCYCMYGVSFSFSCAREYCRLYAYNVHNGRVASDHWSHTVWRRLL